MKKAALISVSNRDGLLEFAKGLVELGYELLTTSGSGRYLAQHGINSIAIEQYTAQKEILDGRVKTLHPKIYAGLLARRDHPEDIKQIEEDGVMLIDVAAVNLYPFSANVGKGKSRDEMIELIDIGGPSMIRAASKNFKFVLPLIDPADYPFALEYLANKSKVAAEEDFNFRQKLALKVFASLARDAVEIASHFSSPEELKQVGGLAERVSLLSTSVAVSQDSSCAALPALSGAVVVKSQDLRYGENPHQKAAFYRPIGQKDIGWEQLGGKELSYNNILDVDATLKMLRSMPVRQSAAVIVKHLNPCGAASGPDIAEAIIKAKRCDPRSHFGGIIGCTTCMSLQAAQEVRGDFAEIVIAPDFSEEALAELRKSKNLRLIKADLSRSPSNMEIRSALGGLLFQQADSEVSTMAKAETVSKRKASASELADLQFAWTMCAHVKSNAIVLVKDCTLVAVGAGQMSRIDSVEVALMKARIHGHDLKGAVAASDAFFPFPDSVQTLAQNGIKAIVAPRGAKRDAEAIATADTEGISLLFVEDRHFRH